MEAVEDRMKGWIASLGYDYATELFSRLPKGKRLRAKLISKIAPESEKSVDLAAVVEMIHAASLLHDDVIDEAMTRRGVASINATDGSKSAIMMGDILYSKAFVELASFSAEVSRSVAGAVSALSIGEMLDVQMSKTINIDALKYEHMIYLKTASLIEACAKSAALISNKNADAYGLYGKNLGLAFQIIDDILDITQNEETLGKPAFSDFKEGKTTLPYIYLYEALSSSDRVRLMKAHGKEISEAEKAWIYESMIEHKCIQRSYSLARELSEEAIKAVSQYDEHELVKIVEEMMRRSF